MKSDENYTKIIENISKIKKINKDESNIVSKRIRLLSVRRFHFLKPYSRGAFFIFADVVDHDSGIREILYLVYDHEDNTSSEIITSMIFPFMFSSPSNHFVEFITKGPLNSNVLEIETALIATN